MGLTLAKRPACGADLNLETNTNYFYCPHCGSKVLQQEDRIVIEHVVRTVDEAKVQREELKKARVQASVEKEKIEAERIKSITPAIMLMMLVLMLVLLSIAKTPPVIMLIVVLVGGLVAYKSVKQNSSHDKHDDKGNE